MSIARRRNILNVAHLLEKIGDPCSTLPATSCQSHVKRIIICERPKSKITNILRNGHANYMFF